MEDLRTVIVPKNTIIKIEGIPFVLAEDAKIQGVPDNIAIIWDSIKTFNSENPNQLNPQI